MYIHGVDSVAVLLRCMLDIEWFYLQEHVLDIQQAARLDSFFAFPFPLDLGAFTFAALRPPGQDAFNDEGNAVGPEKIQKVAKG